MAFARPHALVLLLVAVGVPLMIGLCGTSRESSTQSLAGDHHDRVMCHLNRIQAKQEIIHQLIQDRISLRQAAERFLELLKGDEFALAPMRQLYPTSTDLESCTKSIVEYVRLEMALQDPANARQIQAQVQQQYHEEFVSGFEDSPLARESILAAGFVCGSGPSGLPRHQPKWGKIVHFRGEK